MNIETLMGLIIIAGFVLFAFGLGNDFRPVNAWKWWGVVGAVGVVMAYGGMFGIAVRSLSQM